MQEFDHSSYNYDAILAGAEPIENMVTQAASIANIFTLFVDKLCHIIKQSIAKMEANSGAYTFALHALSSS